MRFLPAVVLCATLAMAQAAPPAAESSSPKDAPEAPLRVTVPAGTRIPLALKHAISTKSVRPGDPVYLQTTFPVAENNRILIPAGTYVQGVVDSVKRAGRVSGRQSAERHRFPGRWSISPPSVLNAKGGAASYCDQLRRRPNRSTLINELRTP